VAGKDMLGDFSSD